MSRASSTGFEVVVAAVATEEGTTNNNNYIITIKNSNQGRVLFSENENRAPTLIFFQF